MTPATLYLSNLFPQFTSITEKEPLVTLLIEYPTNSQMLPMRLQLLLQQNVSFSDLNFKIHTKIGYFLDSDLGSDLILIHAGAVKSF